MSTRKGPLSDQEFEKAFERLLYNSEPVTPEEVDALLRSEGLDPEAIAARGRAIAEKALADSPLDWRNSREQRLRAERALKAAEVRAMMPRKDILTAICDVLAGPNALQAQAILQHRNLEEMPDEDLASLLIELEFLTGGEQE